MLDTATPVDDHIDNVLSIEAARKVAELKTNIFFPVEAVPLTDLTGKPDNGQIAIVRDPGTPQERILATHSDRYKLVKNQQVFDIVENAIKKAKGLKTDGMYREYKLAFNGGITIVNYVFPEHETFVSDDDATQMRITVVNSYNGSASFQMMVGGFRLLCLNGMVAGTTSNRYKARHTSGLSLDTMTNRLHNGIEIFQNIGEKWKVWANTKITDEQAFAYIEQAPTTKQQHDQMKLYWLTEKSTLGNTIWALYNALTYWSTHHKISRGKGNESATILKREADVAKVVSILEAA